MTAYQQPILLRDCKTTRRNLLPSGKERDNLSCEIARHNEQIRRIKFGGEYCFSKRKVD